MPDPSQVLIIVALILTVIFAAYKLLSVYEAVVLTIIEVALLTPLLPLLHK